MRLVVGDQIDRLREAGPDLAARARRLEERLIAAGVPEAVPLEHQLAGLPWLFPARPVSRAG